VRARRDLVLWRSYQAIAEVHRATAVQRAHPEYAAPPALIEGLRRLIARMS
jgi:hypothetical protein